MADSPYNFSTSQAGITPSEPWAKKIMRWVVGPAVFDSRDGSSPTASYRAKDSTVRGAGMPAIEVGTAQPYIWRKFTERKAVHLDIDRMDAEDELVSEALDVYADCTLAFKDIGQTVSRKKNQPGNPDEHVLKVVCDDAEAKKVIEDLIRRLDLRGQGLWQIARDMVKHGSELREVVVDRSNKDQLRIGALKQTIAYEIWPNETDKGDKIPGWVYRRDQNIYNVQKGQSMEEWQIAPFFFGSMIGNLAIPRLASARRNWSRMSKTEDGMVVARLTRAYDKYVHRVPVTQGKTADEVMATLRTYRENATKQKLSGGGMDLTRVSSDDDVTTDFYLPDFGDGKGGVSVLHGSNAQLGNLNDYYVLRERLLARLAVPISYLQIMSTQKTHLRAGNGMSDIDTQFARRLRMLQSNLKTGLRRVFNIELAFHGHVNVPFDLEMTPIVTKDLKTDAEVWLTMAQAAVYFNEAFGVLPVDLLAEKFLGLTPGEESEMFDEFSKKYAQRIITAKVKALELSAEPKPTAPGMKDRLPGDNKSGSGNNNKSRAARSSEQKGAAATQGFDVSAAVDIFSELHQDLYGEELDMHDRIKLADRLLEIAS